MRILLTVFCYNERKKIQQVLKKFNDYRSYDVLIMDDGSNDGYEEDLKDPSLHFSILKNEKNQGVGFSVRRVFEYAHTQKYDAVILVAGNDKDAPEDVPKLLNKLQEGCDFIQGSRYLEGGRTGNMPLYRQISTRYLHPWLFSLITQRKITDSTNGFRAIRLSMLRDSRIDLNQDWLTQYELEPYLFYKALRLGYKVAEVPVTKIYPDKKLGYSKMKPITGWWSILRPLIFLGLGIKK